MAIILALQQLYSDVVERFEDEGTEVPNVFGWRKPAERGGLQNRIVWVPGDPSGAAGALIGARQPGRNPRPLNTLEEMFKVYIEGRDTSDPENELLQYAATRELFDAWYRAVYLSTTGRGLVTVKSASWMVDRNVRRHGATLRVVCTVQAMIPDEAHVVAEDVEAVVAVEAPNESAEDEFDVPPLEET